MVKAEEYTEVEAGSTSPCMAMPVDPKRNDVEMGTGTLQEPALAQNQVEPPLGTLTSSEVSPTLADDIVSEVLPEMPAPEVALDADMHPAPAAEVERPSKEAHEPVDQSPSNQAQVEPAPSTAPVQSQGQVHQPGRMDEPSMDANHDGAAGLTPPKSPSRMLQRGKPFFPDNQPAEVERPSKEAHEPVDQSPSNQAQVEPAPSTAPVQSQGQVHQPGRMDEPSMDANHDGAAGSTPSKSPSRMLQRGKPLLPDNQLGDSELYPTGSEDLPTPVAPSPKCPSKPQEVDGTQEGPSAMSPMRHPSRKRAAEDNGEFEVETTPPEPLSQGAIYKRMYRIFKPRKDGTYQVDKSFVDAYADVKGGRLELESMFEKVGYSVDRGCKSCCRVCFSSRVEVFTCFGMFCALVSRLKPHARTNL